MAKPGRISSLLDIHTEFQDIEENLDMALGLHGTTHDTKGKNRQAVPGNHGGNNGVEGPFTGFKHIHVAFIETKKGAPVLDAGHHLVVAPASRVLCVRTCSKSPGSNSLSPPRALRLLSSLSSLF